MTEPAQVAIVGAGIVATAIAHTLTKRGIRVALFEKGKPQPYPYIDAFQDEVVNLVYRGENDLELDLRKLTTDTPYKRDLNRERHMWVGGSATRWSAIALRKQASEFRTKSSFGYGADWPITYQDLEPYYSSAEQYLGVSGTDEDNPFAPPRSKPFPLPPFELTSGDRWVAEKLAAKGIKLHTTPQARTRLAYDGRPACVNFGACATCPIGARYSPQHHLAQAMATGLVEMNTETSVRRVLVDDKGRATGLLIRKNNSSKDEEYPAKIVIVAAGTIETNRLMLLSAKDRKGPGLGAEGGWIGHEFALHHVYNGELHFKEAVYPVRTGALTAQSFQFLEPHAKGHFGGLKIGVGSGQILNRNGPWAGDGTARMTAEDIGSEHVDTKKYKTGADILASMKRLPYSWVLRLACEAGASADKRIELSKEVDRFGDPVAHVAYKPNDFDNATYEHAGEVFKQFVEASDATDSKLGKQENFDSGDHHMGGCRMSKTVADGVVDSVCRVHGSPNLYVVGGASFVTSGSVNPTLTMVALALRTAEHVMSEIPK